MSKYNKPPCPCYAFFGNFESSLSGKYKDYDSNEYYIVLCNTNRTVITSYLCGYEFSSVYFMEEVSFDLALYSTTRIRNIWKPHVFQLLDTPWESCSTNNPLEIRKNGEVVIDFSDKDRDKFRENWEDYWDNKEKEQ